MALVLKTVGVEAIKKYIAFQPNNSADDILGLNSSGKNKIDLTCYNSKLGEM